jgi:hypothetical protein
LLFGTVNEVATAVLGQEGVVVEGVRDDLLGHVVGEVVVEQENPRAATSVLDIVIMRTLQYVVR